MKITKLLVTAAISLLCFSTTFAQKTEVTVTLTEQFFDALLDGIYQSGVSPEFSLAEARGSDASAKGAKNVSVSNSFAANTGECRESIRLLRENNGVRTSVIFRDGKIMAPIAFSGAYEAPLIGCIPFSGLAESNIELQFDEAGQKLSARVKVTNVALNGTGGVGGSVIARMVQSSIDKKINPIEIVKLEKLSTVIPLQNSASLKMKATGIRHDIGNGFLNIRIAYEFSKGN